MTTTCTATHSAEIDAPGWLPADRQSDRIQAVFGTTGDSCPQVDEETLSEYYRYLSANLSFPFVAHYPEPTNPQEENDFRCVVLELLDPAKHLGDEFDGIFCKTRKGKYEINLPLGELQVSAGGPNGQLIDDYLYWFWNWR